MSITSYCLLLCFYTLNHLSCINGTTIAVYSLEAFSQTRFQQLYYFVNHGFIKNNFVILL